LLMLYARTLEATPHRLSGIAVMLSA